MFGQSNRNDQLEVASESGITEPNQSGLYNEEDNNPEMVQQRRMKDLQNWALYMIRIKQESHPLNS